MAPIDVDEEGDGGKEHLPVIDGREEHLGRKDQEGPKEAHRKRPGDAGHVESTAVPLEVTLTWT